MDFKSFEEVDRLTIPEYELLMEAARLKQVDLDYRNHLQAWLGFAAQATKQSGKKSKPVYNRFDKFYDYEKQVNKVRNKSNQPSTRLSGLRRYMKERG